MGFLTDSIHAGQTPDPATRSVTVPLYQTSTYAHTSLGKHMGWGYARGQNPTRDALERNLAALEKARFGLVFGSGMASIHAATSLLSKGDHVVSTAVVYGGTYRLFMTVLARYGLEFSFVDTGDLGKVKEAMRPSTKMVYMETPTNPLLSLTDIAAVAALARAAGALSVVDNTFLSPYFQRPLELGADLVSHSTTKYLNGHSDSVGGALMLNDEELYRRLKHYQNAAGAILSPFDCWLVMRGTKTLGLRMRQHDASAQAIAGFLSGHPKVLKVYYPGLPSHPQHALARRQQKGFGGMLSFELGDFAAAERFLNKVKVCTLAESLGGVETLICHPATMTHGAIPAEEREKLGITPGLVRLSVGCEDVEDLLADLAQALE